jgi:hypothetical protein
MFFTITLNGKNFEVFASSVTKAIKQAIMNYGKDRVNDFWEGYPLVNNEKFNKCVVCLGYVGEKPRRRKF